MSIVRRKGATAAPSKSDLQIRFLDKDYRRRFVALVADLVEADRQSIITRLAEASRESPAAQQMPLVDTRGKSTLAGIMNIVTGDAAVTIRVDSPRFEMHLADIIFGSHVELQATQSALRHWYIEIIPDLNEPAPILSRLHKRRRAHWAGPSQFNPEGPCRQVLFAARYGGTTPLAGVRAYFATSAIPLVFTDDLD